MASQATRTKPIIYPESDGKPMGETGIHVHCTLELYGALFQHFRRRRKVYVGSNLFVYYQESDPRKVVCPDVFVAFGVRGGQRRIWKIWEEGKGPDIVFEISSESTRLEDLGNKRVLYAELGVREYFIFDPLREWLDPPLRGYRLVGQDYEVMEESTLHSDLLRLEVHYEAERIRLYDPAADGWLLAPWDEAEAREEAEKRLQQAEAQLRNAQQELARLRDQLKRQRRKG